MAQKSGGKRLVFPNNPLLDSEDLEKKVLLELRAARAKPPFLLIVDRLPIKSANEVILQALDAAELMAAPRTALPARMDCFPFNRFAILGRWVLTLENFLFQKEREALRHAIMAQRQQVALIQQINDHLVQIAQYLSRKEFTENE